MPLSLEGCQRYVRSVIQIPPVPEAFQTAALHLHLAFETTSRSRSPISSHSCDGSCPMSCQMWVLLLLTRRANANQIATAWFHPLSSIKTTKSFLHVQSMIVLGCPSLQCVSAVLGVSITCFCNCFS